MKCSSCDTENRLSAKYCDFCGKEVSRLNTSRNIKKKYYFNINNVLIGIAALSLPVLSINTYLTYKNHNELIQLISSHPFAFQSQPALPAIQPIILPQVQSIAPNVATAPSIQTQINEQSAAKFAADAAAASELARIKGIIFSKVRIAWMQSADTWMRSISATKGLKCTIKVKFLPSGDLMDATVVTSSGNEVFDRSAENAVRRASPLPVPQDRNLFNQNFRELTFPFKPE